MLIYLDTNLWNKLCDQNVRATNLLESLRARRAQLVLGTEAIYELAKTFQMKRPDASDRGAKLFSYLLQFVYLKTPCLNMTGDLLREEMKKAARETRDVSLFLTVRNYDNLAQEVRKLSMGNFDSVADKFISSRKMQAREERAQIVEFFKSRPAAKERLAEVPLGELAELMRSEVRKFGRRLLRWRIAWEFPEASSRQLAFLTKRLVENKSYRVSHGLMRGDIYISWRYAHTDSMSSDIPDDLYHIVNSAYCDRYATEEKGQATYAPFILGPNSVALHDGESDLGNWLLALAEST